MRRIIGTLGLLAGVAFGVICTFLMYREHVREERTHDLQITAALGINELKPLTLGRVTQYVLIRGEDRTKPVLLLLHGGPGGSILVDQQYFTRTLEKHFVVVNWDQRGAGKSAHRELSSQQLSVEQCVADTVELIGYLKQHLGVQKIYLLGHSWGAALGALVASRYPGLLYAYIGAGQPVNLAENEVVSYDHAVHFAQEDRNETALKQLASLKPPYVDMPPEESLRQLLIEREWLWRYIDKKRELSPGSVAPSGWRDLLFSPYYALHEVIDSQKAILETPKKMWKALMRIDLERQAPNFQVPVYFFIGRYDFQVVNELSERYFNKISAPTKSLFWFEHSAHEMLTEEPQRFQDLLVNRVLPETYGKPGPAAL